MDEESKDVLVPLWFNVQFMCSQLASSGGSMVSTFDYEPGGPSSSSS